MSNLSTSPRGKQFIVQREGLKLKPYLCSAGHPTIGIGHLIRKHENFSAGITVQRAYEIFDADLKIPELFINAVLSPSKINGAPLNQNEFDAIVSFCINFGVGALDESTLLKKLQAGDRAGAANEFPKWKYERRNGVMIANAGLLKRRNLERILFLEPVND